MAKATEKDMEAALLLHGILSDVADGKYPRGLDGECKDDEPDFFDENDRDHLRAFYDRVMHCMESPAAISRVIWGFHTIMHNNVVDPDKDHLELHPRLNSDSLLAAAKESLAAIHEVNKAFGTPGDYGYDHPEGKALFRLYTGTGPLSKAINEKEPKVEQPKEAKSA